MKRDNQASPALRMARVLVGVANLIFAAAFVVALLGYWKTAIAVIGFGLTPGIVAEVVRRK